MQKTLIIGRQIHVPEGTAGFRTHPAGKRIEPVTRPGIVALRALILFILLAGLALPSSGQTVRPPELRQEFHRAERAWRTGTNLYEAKIRLDRVLEAMPDDAQARLIRARVLLDLDRPAEALADARVATDIDSSDGSAWLVRAEAAQKLVDARDEALDALDHAADRITEGVDEHVRLSWVAQSLSEVDRAEAFARIALALGPDEPAAYWRLAEVFAKQGRPGDAETLIARGLEDGVLSRTSLLAHPILAPFADSAAIRPHLDG